MQLPLLFLAPSLAAAAVPALFARVCGDNCARAVIASAFTTRQGAQDCSSYLRTTVTPATSTVTVTATSSFTATDTESVTSTTSTTTTVFETAVNTAFETRTLTTTTTAAAQAPQKRQETSSPSDIPLYASACSGAARYSTACSCVGVTPTTITAATPLTTTTVYVSSTSTTTLVVTASTETDVETATSTESTTTTKTEEATATATVTPALETFHIRAVGGPYDAKYVKLYSTETSTDFSYTQFRANGDSTDDAGVFYLSGGHVYYKSQYHGDQPIIAYKGTNGGVSDYVYFMSQSTADYYAAGYAPAPCSVSSDMLLHCSEALDTSYNIWRQASGLLFLTSAADLNTYYTDNTYAISGLQVVPM